MLKKSLLILCVLSAAILIGCSTAGNTNSTTANSNSSSGSTTTSSPATTTSNPATTTTASAGDKIGVPECDDFIAKYEACVSGKVPEMARAQFQSMLKTWRTEWKKAADNPQTKAALAQGCKMSAEQANASMKAYGCSF
jgi:hypothetical protein